MLRLGYDVGGMSIRACLLDDENYQILYKATRPFPQGKGEQAFVSTLVDLAEEVLTPMGLRYSDVLSVGMGIPGTVNREKGILLTACNLNLNGMHVREHIQKCFPKAKVDVANDADVAALAELHAGAFRGYDSALLITIGTGIGSGYILNGKLFQGGMGVGVELGHITLQQNGLMCTCGNKGCAETLCSASWLIKMGRHSVIDYPMSAIAAGAQGKIENVTAKMVLDAAQAGDGIAVQIFNEYIDNLTSLLTTCCYMFGPKIIALGGGVSNVNSFLLDPLKAKVMPRCRQYKPEHIVSAALGDSAGMIGAAMLPSEA